jgi:heptosyltransferase-2
MSTAPHQPGGNAVATGKPRLLVVELWGLGDLVIATPFLQAAQARYEVTLLAKPYALELQSRLWPGIKIVPFNAPWTAFKKKYRLWRWPVGEMARLWRHLGRQQFQYGVSSRWDPRDHALLRGLGVPHRLGFARYHSEFFLTQALRKPDPQAHHYEYWRVSGEALGLALPTRAQLPVPRRHPGKPVLVHSGARLAVRVWPLDRYLMIVRRLRAQGLQVQVVCDPEQLDWWRHAGEKAAACPTTVQALLDILDRSGIFIGNDSGPGHLAGIVGLPTFTIFGPQLPEWFAPLNPLAQWTEGKSCPYKPCSDYCRLPTPECLWNVTGEEVWQRLQPFLRRTQLPAPETRPP